MNLIISVFLDRLPECYPRLSTVFLIGVYAVCQSVEVNTTVTIPVCYKLVSHVWSCYAIINVFIDQEEV